MNVYRNFSMISPKIQRSVSRRGRCTKWKWYAPDFTFNLVLGIMNYKSAEYKLAAMKTKIIKLWFLVVKIDVMIHRTNDINWVPIHEWFFFCPRLNSVETSPCCNCVVGHQVATNFAHATTAQLSCHVQIFVAITVLELRWKWNEISIEFELRWKNH